MNFGDEAKSGEVTQFVAPSASESAARKRRNVALAIALLGFVALVFVITLVRLQGNVLNRPF